MWPCIINFFVIKPTRCTNFTNLFCRETLYVSGSSSVHHQSLLTVHSAMVYVIQVCRQLPSRLSSMQEHMLLHTRQSAIQNNKYQSWSCSKAVYKPVWHKPLLSVQWINSWWRANDLSEICRVSWQKKFVKLVHLVGFTTKKKYSQFGY
jgi:hypothetical protein